MISFNYITKYSHHLLKILLLLKIKIIALIHLIITILKLRPKNKFNPVLNNSILSYTIILSQKF